MKRNVGLALALGALVVAGCGEDKKEVDDRDEGGSTNADAGTTKADASSGKGDAGTTSTQNPSTGGGKCSKGEYKGREMELTYCGPIEDDDGSCPPISELSGYTKVTADLNIFPVVDADLKDVSCLETVGSIVIGQSDEVTTLEPLSNIKTAAGVEIISMTKLTSLAGLDGLKQLSALTINGNDGLTDLTGLPKGLKVGSLYVAFNDNLASLDGLVASGIEITNTLAFENNPKLSSCTAAEFAKRFPNAELSNFGNLVETCK